MSHWNHRVCKETIDTGIAQVSGDKLIEYTIREAFYNEAGDVCAVTENDPPIGVYALDEYYPPEEEKPSEEDILNEMKETVQRFEKALSLPILDIDTIVFAEWDSFEDESDFDDDEDDFDDDEEEQ